MTRLLTILTCSAALSAAILSACGSSSSGGSAFTLYSTTVSVAGGTPVAIGGKNLAFLADEATTGAGGTDMNLDGDMIDSIGVAVDTATRVETNLGVAVIAMAWIGNELYLVVDEAADERDWNVDTDMVDLVLLHWTAGDMTTVADFDFIDRVAAGTAPKMVAQGTNLFYSSARAPTAAGDSTLQWIASSAPLVFTSVTTQDTDPNGLRPRILGKEEGLLFLALDEVVEARDLNGDTDATDTSVLALLDVTLTTTIIRNTGLAVPAGSPFRGRRTTPSSHDWQVGFLVSEAAQGVAGTNLNSRALFPATWIPPQCGGPPDADATDDVLHFLEFLAWDTDPVLNPPVNTGLVGCRKISIANGYIATISPEFGTPETGAEGICDLNGDGDDDDYVVRWVRINTPVLPLTNVNNIRALFDAPGNTHGLTDLDGRFVIQVSELQDDFDINGDALKTFDLLGWLSPSGDAGTNTPWDFTHGTANNAFSGASWMSEQVDRARLNVALQEKVEGININNDTPPQDIDTLDSVPTFADFTGSPARLAFPGVAIAVDNNSAGIVVARGFGFYRVSEPEDSRSWNVPSDGDETDYILFRTSLAAGTSASMGVLSLLDRPAIDVNLEETPVCGAFLADEAMQGGAGTDFNGDGDTADLVLRYFRF